VIVRALISDIVKIFTELVWDDLRQNVPPEADGSTVLTAGRFADSGGNCWQLANWLSGEGCGGGMDLD